MAHLAYVECRRRRTIPPDNPVRAGLRKICRQEIARFAGRWQREEQAFADIGTAQVFGVAAERHVDHRRKGEPAEPYVNHLAEVADLVAEATNGSDPNLVVAAVLHDTIEDTGLTYAELQALCAALRY